MLIEFRFKNYRSFRDEAVLSMEAVGLGSFKKSLIEQNNMKLLPGVGKFLRYGLTIATRLAISPKMQMYIFHHLTTNPFYFPIHRELQSF